MQTHIEQFVRSHYSAIGQRALRPDTALFSSGLIDSFGVLELIVFLEDTFHITIDPAVHELSAFDTIGRITTLVTRLQREQAAG